ncbi:PP2C family protein-serine/threonine phosphatase [Crossiella sp. CA-258035]|uniref:PP2C family protein-serine/threonine phosphatase n=1 Tax=Crossiella sp. CA-258035 TaxID=2981138 RepID=UPI0024BC9505|nr:PP2C family protein-serine/threonine phosphatase [Crossiella sp. CA-258035]WHT23284.1 PP2C family protein-serine/threonine phosphatase [Crossiella sp. CA-258035]
MVDYPAVERLLRAAAPHELLDILHKALATSAGATGVQLLMADYGLMRLQPVSVLPYTNTPVPVHNTAPGRAFGAQEPHLERHEDGTISVYLPVSVRGDRLGVLCVALPEPPDAELVATLAELAGVLAHEITVAERDTDLYVQARRAERLTLAAEMQWQLLPGRACARPEFSLGAQLEPAYAVHGDNFDWSASADHLTLTVSNGMGEGIDAALLTNLAINALRNARRAGIPLADQAMLADQAIFGQYHGAKHVAALLVRLNLADGRAEVVDAGSPRLWRMRGGEVRPVEFEAQLPLGMFDGTPYVSQHFELQTGDRLVFVTDGVYDVASQQGERYGERALAKAITATRLLPATHVPRSLLQELVGYRNPTQITVAEDDAMVVCLDWHGRD